MLRPLPYHRWEDIPPARLNPFLPAGHVLRFDDSLKSIARWERSYKFKENGGTGAGTNPLLQTHRSKPEKADLADFESTLWRQN